MYCSRCGAENPDNNIACSRCEHPLAPGGPPVADAGGMPQPYYPQYPQQYPPQYGQAGPYPPGYGAPPYGQGGYYPQTGPSGYPLPQTVPNYLVQAILVTLFCCLPAGIAAIVYASQVNTKLAMGDYAGALQASKNANLWSWISFGTSFGVIVLYIIVIAIAGIN